MTKEDIIRMALEAGCLGPGEGADPNGLWEPNGVENVTVLMHKFAFLVAAAEREGMRSEGWRQCAQGQKTTQHCAAAERERIIAANAPEIAHVNAYIAALEEAVSAEREACAKVCENEGARIDASWMSCAAAIRARGDK